MISKEIELKVDSLLNRVSAIGQSKQQASDRIRSKGTLRSYRQCLKEYMMWRYDMSLPNHTLDAVQILETYLEELSEWYVQSTLDQHRMALSRVFHKHIKKITARRVTDLKKRCYQPSEVEEIVRQLPEDYAVSVLLCFFIGVRAHEIATLRRQNEIERSSSRKWRADLFLDLQDYQFYVVTGKGGLRRYVAVPDVLVALLEKYRLTNPKIVKDRKIEYITYYNLPFGQCLSQRFGEQSMITLRRKAGGLHGLRHSYAQNRLRTLMRHGVNFDTSRAIVSQELGHFRPQITNTYLR